MASSLSSLGQSVGGAPRQETPLLPDEPFLPEASLFRALKPKADSGDAAAQVEVGWLYDVGCGVQQDHCRAYEYWKKAAAQQQALGQYNVAVMYAAGQGVARDFDQAAAWWGKTAEPWDILATYQLGWLTALGRGVPKDYTLARRRWQEAARVGYSVAKTELGLEFPEVGLSDARVHVRKVTMTNSTPRGDAAYLAYTIASRELSFPVVSFVNAQGKFLENVHVIGRTPSSLYTRGNDGVCCEEVKLANLPPELQKQFGYEPQKAKTYDQARQAGYAGPDADAFRWQRNLDTITQILADYAKGHTYKEDVFICGDYACDVWNQMHTKGIPARVAVGSAKRNIQNWNEADHAWVMAELSPGQWVAVEPQGKVVFPGQDEHYYKCLWLMDAGEFRKYEAERRTYNECANKLETATKDFNEFAAQYNAADPFTRQRLKNTLAARDAVFKERQDDLRKSADRLNTWQSAR